MVTYYPHRVASRDRVEADNDVQPTDDGLGTRVLNHVRQAFCGMTGHDILRHFERNRMFLKCVSCGHESPGWALTEPRPTAKPRGDVRRPALVTGRST